MSEDLRYQIAITKLENIGPILAKFLISYCGGVKEVFDQTQRSLSTIPNIGPKKIKNILNYQNALELADKEIEFVKRHEIQPLFFLSDDYPRRLRNFEDCPIMLYYKGSADLNHFRMVGIVGTRMPTENGKVICEKIVAGLATYNAFVVSGLAFGIDATAHRSSLEAGIPTIGIMGHGMDMIYPAENRELSKSMTSCGGLLTEFTSETKLDPGHFPMRNRIIAALSDAVVVIESKKRGGSIITAEIANNYNKDVFAVPGRVNDSKSEGCNRLIKQHKAYLIESAADIAYIMQWEKLDMDKTVQAQLFTELDASEQEVVDLLRKEKQMEIDTMNYKLGLSSSELASKLLSLEFKGIIKSLPGKKYILR